MNGFGGRGFEKDFKSLFQSRHQNIGQLVAFVFQEQRAHGFILTLKKRSISFDISSVLFFTGIITAIRRG